MQTRPPTSLLMLVMLVGVGIMMAMAVSSVQQASSTDPSRGVMLLGCGVLAGIGGFKVGRLLASGGLSFGKRLCRSCSARRTTDAAFCESCHRRD